MNETVLNETDDRPPLSQEDSVADYTAQQAETQELDVLAGLREVDNAEGVRWKVFRINDMDLTRNGFLDEVGTVGLTAMMIRDKFGYGTYRIRGHYPNGQYAAQRTLTIAGDAPQRPIVLPGNQNMSFGGASYDEWERREDQRRERARKERLEMVALIGPIAGPIIAAMVGRQGPQLDVAALIAATKGPSMVDMLAAVAQLKALTPQPTGDPIERALKIIEAIQDKAPNANGETGWLDVLREAVKHLGPSLGGAIEGALAKAPALPSPTRESPPSLPAPIVDSPSPSSSGASGMLSLLPWLRSQLEMLILKAARGSDPALYAAVLADSVPEGVSPQTIVNFLNQPNWFDYVGQLDERAKPFVEWFKILRHELIAELGGEVLRVQGEPANFDTPATAAAATPSHATIVERPSGAPPSLDE